MYRHVMDKINSKIYFMNWLYGQNVWWKFLLRSAIVQYHTKVGNLIKQLESAKNFVQYLKVGSGPYDTVALPALVAVAILYG